MRILPVAFVVLAACHSGTASQTQDFNESDPDLAAKAVQVLTQAHGCSGCHTVSRAQMMLWQSYTTNAQFNCVPKTSRPYLYQPSASDPNKLLAKPLCTTPGEVTAGDCYLDPASALVTQAQAKAALDCFRTGGGADGAFNPINAGVHAMEIHPRNSHYTALLAKAYPDATERAQVSTVFFRDMLMPRGGLYPDQYPATGDYSAIVTKENFAIVQELFDRNFAGLDSVLPIPSGPTTCVPHIEDDLKAYVVANARKGWTFKNASNALAMYGCPSDTLGGYPDTALACLQDKPIAPEWEAHYTDSAAGSHIRTLGPIHGHTQYWMRASPDGRFVANGGADAFGTSYVTDLQTGTDIPVEADYDPAFLPDNSSFMFQGTPHGAAFCPLDLLQHPPMASGALTPIDFGEDGCGSTQQIGTYQHLGTSLDGGASFACNSNYAADFGGGVNANTPAVADYSTQAQITPFIHNGSTYNFLPAVPVPAPFEGDDAISPTTRLFNGRLAGPNAKQLGYDVRMVSLAQDSGGAWSVGLSKPSTFCTSGGKAEHSYDDRFMVMHDYSVGASGMTGVANIKIVDLSDGSTTQVTQMPDGAYALFPHFRSDGWLYFQGRDANGERMMASDIALRIEKAKPINNVTW